MVTMDPRALTEKLKAVVNSRRAELEPSFVRELQAQRLDLNSFHYNVLMSSCRGRGSWRGAAEWLKHMQKDMLQPDACSIHTAITSCKDSSLWTKAVLFFRQMPVQSLATDATGFGATLAAAQGEDWRLALLLWSSRYGTAKSLRTQIGCGAVLKAFQQSSWCNAICMLQDMSVTRMEPDLISCSTIAGHCQMADQWQKALFLLTDMEGLDDVALSCHWQDALELGHGAGAGILECTAALCACSEGTAWESAAWILTCANPDVIACNTGISTLRDAAQWQLAISVSESMAFKRIAADEASIHVQIQSSELVSLWEAAVQSLQSMKKRCLRQGVFSITSTLSTMHGDSGNFGNPWQKALSFIVNFEEAAVQLNTASYSAAPLMWRQSIDLFSYLQGRRLQLDRQSHTGVLHTVGTALKWMSALSALTCMQWNSITPDTACYNILTNAGDQWRWVLAMLEETPKPDHMSLSAAMRMCDQFDISVGKNILSRYHNESASSASSSSVSASILWAMARLTVQDQVQVCKSFAQVASVELHDLPKLCWAAGTLGVASSSIQRHLKHLHKVLDQLSMKELQLISWGSASVAPDVLMAIQREVIRRMESMETNQDFEIHVTEPDRQWIEDILGVLWACSFAACLSQHFREGAWNLVVEAGQRRDRIHAKDKDTKAQVVALGGDDAGTDVKPSIILGLMDRMVVSKPPGWEVHDAGTPRQLHTWLRSLGSWPILGDPEFDFGFLHRLDVPSSGLILVATTYGAYYDLQLQLRSGMIARDYVVLNHGWLKRRKVDARLHWKGNSPTRSGGQGKPSRTRLSKLLALAGAAGSTFTLMLIRVLTGRRHQIRSHSMHIGHPTVSDGRYTSAETFQKDSAFCARNFLHRWSLTFRNAEREVRKTKLPLPMDLREAASKLTCVGQSEESSSHKFRKMFGEDGVPQRISGKDVIWHHVTFHVAV
eukprot:s205_g32.t2